MARPTYPSDNVDKTLLRFPEGMQERLKAEAKKNNRSLNAEIIHRLEESLLINIATKTVTNPNDALEKRMAEKFLKLDERIARQNEDLRLLMDEIRTTREKDKQEEVTGFLSAKTV